MIWLWQNEHDLYIHIQLIIELKWFIHEQGSHLFFWIVLSFLVLIHEKKKNSFIDKFTRDAANLSPTHKLGIKKTK
jgi:hypothetical protein